MLDIARLVQSAASSPWPGIPRGIVAVAVDDVFAVQADVIMEPILRPSGDAAMRSSCSCDGARVDDARARSTSFGKCDVTAACDSSAWSRWLWSGGCCSRRLQLLLREIDDRSDVVASTGS